MIFFANSISWTNAPSTYEWIPDPLIEAVKKAKTEKKKQEDRFHGSCEVVSAGPAKRPGCQVFRSGALHRKINSTQLDSLKETKHHLQSNTLLPPGRYCVGEQNNPHAPIGEDPFRFTPILDHQQIVTDFPTQRGLDLALEHDIH